MPFSDDDNMRYEEGFKFVGFMVDLRCEGSSFTAITTKMNDGGQIYAHRSGVDKPFAWESREYLRKLCMGKDVTFKVDYTVPSIGREFSFVFLGDKNVALIVVSNGWVKNECYANRLANYYWLKTTLYNFPFNSLTSEGYADGLAGYDLVVYQCYCPFSCGLWWRFVPWVVVGYGVPMKLAVLP
ncbi:hypothetical protein TEA_008747 [Camellia sinensis var. sinensis]|uniref:TNase-like domain-containing protein n=1 Tax=Camellia sinensis var. sinensis TaxID=542762 RepID=A0A4S4EQG8_CAMSN|nr:hypothetical protein TEA_008747 [Camellia sinensis var. sinensis]